jgi:siderophore synthetase component
MRTTTTEKRLKTSIAIRPTCWRELRIVALRQGRDASEILEQLIEKYLAKQAKKEVQ